MNLWEQLEICKFFWFSIFDDEFEISNDYEDYDSGYNSDVENSLNTSQIIYNHDAFISDPDSEAEVNEGIQKLIDNE